MTKTKNRLRLCAALLTVNLLFIWGNSMLPGHISGALSDLVKDLIALLFGGHGSGAPGGGLLRKLAHFTEFTCLGMCLCWLFGMLREKTAEYCGLSLTAGILVAAVDETIQMFVPQRGPAIKDVGIDTLGVILGIFIIFTAHYLKKRRTKI